jgi:hypothetical protein
MAPNYFQFQKAISVLDCACAALSWGQFYCEGKPALGQLGTAAPGAIDCALDFWSWVQPQTAKEYLTILGMEMFLYWLNVQALTAAGISSAQACNRYRCGCPDYWLWVPPLSEPPPFPLPIF